MPINLDHVGLNTLIQEPVTASQNTIGHNLDEDVNSYINDDVVSISDSDYLVSLNIHRNGPYGWPIFKQTRIGENPLTRYQKRNSIFTYTTEIGDVKLLTKGGKLIDSTRNRRSELRSFIETPVVSGFKPLIVVGSTENESDNDTDTDERVEIEFSYGNETSYFTNDLANKEHNLDDELDEGYEDFVDLYLDGGLDSDDSPLDEFELLKFSQTVYPRQKNTFSDDIRNRPSFESGYWKDSSNDRLQTGNIDNGFGFTIPSLSLWPLDVEANWKTRALGATVGFFSASVPIKWAQGYGGKARGLNFELGSNKIIMDTSGDSLANYWSDVSPGDENRITKVNQTVRIFPEIGSLNSVEGSRRFWNSLNDAMFQLGLRPSGSDTSFFDPNDAFFETGSAYKLPRNDDRNYNLNISPTAWTHYRHLYDTAFTLSWRQIGAFSLDANGGSIRNNGTYYRVRDISSLNDPIRFRLQQIEEGKFKINIANDYTITDWNGGTSTVESSENVSDGGSEIIYTIDNSNYSFRGWSSIVVEIDSGSAPAMLVNAVEQQASVTNNFYAYTDGVTYLNNTSSGPNYAAGSVTGSYGFKINPSTSLSSIFPADNNNFNIIDNSGHTQQLAIVLTLKLGNKPTNTDNQGFSIFTCSGSGDQYLSLISSPQSTNSQIHSRIGLVLQSGSLQTEANKFDKIFWDIPISRANKVTKFYLYADLSTKTNSFGRFNSDIGLLETMEKTTEGTLTGSISSSFDRTSFLSKDSKFFSSPTFFDTDYTICDIAILKDNGGASLDSGATINKFMHSGSAYNYASSDNSALSGNVNHWYDFAGDNSTFRIGAAGAVLGSVVNNNFAVGDDGTKNNSLTSDFNPSGSVSIDTGPSTSFRTWSTHGVNRTGEVTVFTGDDTSPNLTSTGDSRIAEFSVISGVNRGASLYYATGSTEKFIFPYVDTTGSAVSSSFSTPRTASILYTFKTGSGDYLDADPLGNNGAYISNRGLASGSYNISRSWSSVEPITGANGTIGSIGEEGMITSSAGFQPFQYRVSNRTQHNLIENDNVTSVQVLGSLSGSIVLPSESDLFVGGDSSYGAADGGGILVNSYNTFNRNEYTSSLTIDQQYTASCIYTRRHSLITGSSFYNPFGMSFQASSSDSQFHQRENLDKFELYQGMAFWDAPDQSGRKPFFNDYNKFAEDPKLIGKDFSIIPEFKISEHIDKYLVSGDTSFSDSDNPLFNIEGGKAGISNSDNDTFYETYSTTEFLKNFDIIQDDHEGFVNPLSITLRCKAIKKLLPYKGFYPADRTVEIAQQFYNSYGNNLLFGSDVTTDVNPKYAAQNLLTPLFSPGILFNSIKSGVACDYPLITSKLRTLSLSSSANGTSGSHFINQQFDTRIPFEALVEPEKYLANVELISNEPDEKASPQTTVVWNGQGDEKYRLMASNFLAEVGDFYLQNENYSTIASLPQGDPNFGNAKAGLEYRMRLRMYRSISGQKDVYGEIKPRNAILITGSLSNAGLHADGTYNVGGLLDSASGLQNSISFWFNINDNDASQKIVALENSATNSKVEIYINTPGGTKTFYLDFMSDSYTNQKSWNWTGLSFSIGEWHHVTLVFNAADMSITPKLYLDGGTGVSGTGGSSSGTGAGSVGAIDTLSIGATKYRTSNQYVIAGAVQDVAVWSAGLTATDASNVYNGGKWKNLITHASASSLISWHLLGEEPNMPISGANLPGNGSNFFVKSQVGGRRQTLFGDTNIVTSFVRDGVGSFGTSTANFSSPVPEGTFAVPQDTGSMSESITMYSRPSAFGPPQKLILSGSSRYKLKFNNWESFKKGNSVSNYYHTTDSLVLSSNTASSDSIFKDLEYSNVGSAFVKGNDASQGYNYPFTPPYYHGEAWADITFKPDETKKYTLSEIVNSSSVEFLRYYEPYRTGSEGETISWRLVNEEAMQLASSINIFSRGILPGTNTTDLDIASSYRWIIQSKFETPILNFNHMAFQEVQNDVNRTASVSIPNIAPETTPIGMWHQYGKIPTDPKEGVFLQATDVPRRWIENATAGNFNSTASLSDLCGFSTDPVRMGEIGSLKEVSEAIVAIPYIEKDGNREFFRISRRDIEHALNPKLRHLVGQSLINMTERIKKFVLPPSMDFVINKEIEPFAMYIFDFTHTFTREDLSNMWQNLQPDISISHEIDEVEISHELLSHELLGGKAELKAAPSSDNEIGAVLDRQARLGEINPNLRWMVFKAKQRAKNNYFEKIFARNESNPNQSDSTITNTSVGKKLNVGFNWPYDFFSLIELGKIEADIVFANPDDENQEEKLVIKPRIKANKVLPRKKEDDSVINNSLFGTGELQAEDVLTADDKSKIKPNPLGNLGRRRRKK